MPQWRLAINLVNRLLQITMEYMKKKAALIINQYIKYKNIIVEFRQCRPSIVDSQECFFLDILELFYLMGCRDTN